MTHPKRLCLASCTVDLDLGRVMKGGRASTLTTMEAGVLAYLAAHPGRVVSRDELFEKVWQHRNPNLSRAVDSAVFRLRAKVERDPSQPDHILTVFGEGYRFHPGEPPAPAQEPPPDLQPSPGQRVLVFVEVDQARLWEQSPDAARETLQHCMAQLQALLAQHGGDCVARGIGVLRAAFPTALKAVRWGLGLRELRYKTAAVDPTSPAQPPPDEAGLPLRIAIHSGIPVCWKNPASSELEYLGPVVTGTQALLESAQPGQLLISGPVLDEVSRFMPLELPFMARAVRVPPARGGDRVLPVYELCPLTGTSPPLLTRTTRLEPGNLPFETIQVIGREPDVARIEGAFAAGRRVITLVGPPGVGKTTLAVHYGNSASSLATWTGGIWFCELTEARDVQQLLEIVARTLGMIPTLKNPEQARWFQQALVARGRVLLILDNFEQLPSQAAVAVQRWAELAPEAGFLVTSREPLGVRSETCLGVNPLAEADAIRLFISLRRQPSPEPAGRDDVDAVAQVVRYLTGIPLAIRLAASRAHILPPAQLLERLVGHFDLLSLGRLEGDERHRSMRTALNWSWTLLSDWERAALTQCVVFRGSFTLEAAEQVLDLEGLPGAPPVMEMVQALVDRSLVNSSMPGDSLGDVRFFMYEIFRQYAQEQGARSGRQAPLQSRHAAHFVKEGERLVAGLRRPGVVLAAKRLLLEQGNLEAAFEWSIDHAPEWAVRLALVLDSLAWLQLSFDRPPTQLTALERVLDGVAPEWQARARLARATWMLWHGSIGAGEVNLWEQADTFLTSALKAALECGDVRLEARVRAACGLLYRLSTRDGGDAEASFRLALSQARAAGDRLLEGDILVTMGAYGYGCTVPGIADAEQQLRTAIQIFREEGDLFHLAQTQAELSSFRSWQGFYEEAELLIQEATAFHRKLMHGKTLLFAYRMMAYVHMEQKSFQRARACLEQSLLLSEQLGFPEAAPLTHASMGLLFYLQGDLEAASCALDTALCLQPEVPFARAQALLYKTALEADRDCLEAAEIHLALARSLPQLEAMPMLRTLLLLAEGLVALGWARTLQRQHDEEASTRYRATAAARLEAGRRHLGRGVPDPAAPPMPPLLSAQPRLLLGRLEEAIEPLDARVSRRH